MPRCKPCYSDDEELAFYANYFEDTGDCIDLCNLGFQDEIEANEQLLQDVECTLEQAA